MLANSRSLHYAVPFGFAQGPAPVGMTILGGLDFSGPGRIGRGDFLGVACGFVVGAWLGFREG
jgi:hypothetical protein